MRGDEKLELATLALGCAATLGLILVMWERHLQFAWRHGSPIIAMTIGLIAVSAIYRTIRPDARIAHLTFALAAQIWTACAIGGLALAAQGSRLPLMDQQLAAADHALGISARAIVTGVAAMPVLGNILSLFYQASVGSIFAALVLFTLLGRTDRVVELGFLFTATIILCAAIGVPFPAYGAFTALGIGPDIRNALPAHAGVYYMPALFAYRFGGASVIDFTQLEGVITFPSFHACMALIMTWGFRRIRYFFWPVAAFNIIVGLSVIPIGGHYGVDIIGAVAVFAITIVAGRTIRRMRLAVPAAAQTIAAPAVQTG